MAKGPKNPERSFGVSVGGVLLLIAAVCGALGKAFAGGSRGGIVTSIALGFVGAVFGSWIGRELKLP